MASPASGYKAVTVIGRVRNCTDSREDEADDILEYYNVATDNTRDIPG